MRKVLAVEADSCVAQKYITYMQFVRQLSMN